MLSWKMDLLRVILFFVCGMMNRMSPICCLLKKLDQVTKSPLTSETLAFSEAPEAGVCCKRYLDYPGCQKSFVKQTMSLVETLISSNLVSYQYLRIDVARNDSKEGDPN